MFYALVFVLSWFSSTPSQCESFLPLAGEGLLYKVHIEVTSKVDSKMGELLGGANGFNIQLNSLLQIEGQKKIQAFDFQNTLVEDRSKMGALQVDANRLQKELDHSFYIERAASKVFIYRPGAQINSVKNFQSLIISNLYWQSEHQNALGIWIQNKKVDKVNGYFESGKDWRRGVEHDSLTKLWTITTTYKTNNQNVKVVIKAKQLKAYQVELKKEMHSNLKKETLSLLVDWESISENYNKGLLEKSNVDNLFANIVNRKIDEKNMYKNTRLLEAYFQLFPNKIPQYVGTALGLAPTGPEFKVLIRGMLFSKRPQAQLALAKILINHKQKKNIIAFMGLISSPTQIALNQFFKARKTIGEKHHPFFDQFLAILIRKSGDYSLQGARFLRKTYLKLAKGPKKIYSIQILGHLASSKDEKFILKAVDDPDDNIKCVALKSLRYYHSKRTNHKLRAFSKSANSRLARCTGLALSMRISKVTPTNQ